jgi:hypothetical protein
MKWVMDSLKKIYHKLTLNSRAIHWLAGRQNQVIEQEKRHMHHRKEQRAHTEKTENKENKENGEDVLKEVTNKITHHSRQKPQQQGKILRNARNYKKSTATTSSTTSSSTYAPRIKHYDDSWSAYGWSWLGYPTEKQMDNSDPLVKTYLNSNAAKSEVAFDSNGPYIKVTKKN